MFDVKLLKRKLFVWSEKIEIRIYAGYKLRKIMMWLKCMLLSAGSNDFSIIKNVFKTKAKAKYLENHNSRNNGPIYFFMHICNRNGKFFLTTISKSTSWKKWKIGLEYLLILIVHHMWYNKIWTQYWIYFKART